MNYDPPYFIILRKGCFKTLLQYRCRSGYIKLVIVPEFRSRLKAIFLSKCNNLIEKSQNIEDQGKYTNGISCCHPGSRYGETNGYGKKQIAYSY